eukprot:890368-Prorocentrum_minimum.AAC.3
MQRVVPAKQQKEEQAEQWASIFGVDHNFGLDEYGRPIVTEEESSGLDSKGLKGRRRSMVSLASQPLHPNDFRELQT